MTKVAIMPVPAAKGAVSYRAVAGDKHSHGATAGQAPSRPVAGQILR